MREGEVVVAYFIALINNFPEGVTGKREHLSQY
jgi:hypothetical protein